MGKRKSMKPMYRTAAEEALILEAIKVNKRGAYSVAWWRGYNRLCDCIDAVERERKEATK